MQPSEEEQEAVTYRLSPESVVAVGEDIRYIKEDPQALKAAARQPEGLWPPLASCRCHRSG